MAGHLPQSPEPYWRETAELPKFNQLHEDIKVNVVIVGGGITGITAAYLLVKEGVKVALIEADHLLNGTTGHTTAKITAQHGLIYDEIIQHMGQSKARMYYEANTDALQFIEKTVKEQQIDCDFKKQDAYLYASTDQYAMKLEQEWKAYQKLSIEGSLKDSIPFNISVHNALSMTNQAQFHPLKYLAHLLKVITDAGSLIFEHTTAVNVEADSQQAAVLTRNGYRVTGHHVLACSHFPFYEGTGLYSTRMYADRSYILGVKTKESYPGGMYLSVDQPTRSLRSASLNGEDIVLIGGESHKTGQGKDTLEHYEALETFGKKVFQVEDILYRWSAQDLTTLDKIPYIGEITSTKPRVLIATGYRKWGMTNGTAAAHLLTDIVLKKENPYKSLYSPSRFYADPSLKKFFIENADVAKHLVKGKIDLPHKKAEELDVDEGSVVTIDGKRKGAYKDKEGQFHIVDTTCTHVGCEVEWNHGDRTWDCPCHGSRFSYTGEVIEGPAEKPLQKEDHTMLENVTEEDSGY
ncbi:FAD-dependent oxidoreductase [Alteribacillus sp. JSM 102045]|uniref:FAD-dependent oxidoreductase n=1 Tax=Alteribacillus sp. JSM 102045 TaxID=1562101 RepID=UPI0035C082E5